jgi:ferredoxin-NADP reductase/DMSO/TMAO reductase YedYZ heme-binding membrane subunit
MIEVRFAKFVVLLNCAVPGALLAWDAFHHQLGANPVNFAILTTGMSALVFLSLTLLVTPLRKLTGWNWLIFFRRTLGLYAFFYASAHFLIFFAGDRAFSLVSTGSEMVKRPYLIIGSLGLACMVPLAVTSTNAMVKRLGAKRWHLLHRLVYVTATAGVVHFYMQSKADKRKPLAFAVAVGFLLGCRLVWYVLAQQKKKNAKQAVPAPVASSQAKPRFWSGQLRVARIVQETPHVRTFRLQALDGSDLPFRYLPGQYLNLSLHIDGKRVNRSYTIASTPTRAATCELTIKREDMGVSSRYMHDTVREGDLLNVSAPAGRFTFTGTEADSIVLIAGGVGITPLMSILRALTDRDWKGAIYLVYCIRQESELIFARELELLREQHDNFHLCVTVSRPENSNWSGPQGRITEELLVKTIPELSRRLCYVCGPTPMMESVMALLQKVGVHESLIKSEAFVYPSKTDSPAAAQGSKEQSDETALPEQADSPALASEAATPNVTFSISRKVVPLLPGQTILEAGEAAGLDLDFECRSGVCGTCKKRLLAGSVMMEVEAALSPKDKADNMILLCQARATQPVTVEA